MNVTVYRVAKDSGIAQSTLAAIVAGHRSISPETAMRLGLYFGVDAQFWLNLQTRYGLMMLGNKRRQIERQVHPLPKAAERLQRLPLLSRVRLQIHWIRSAAGHSVS